MSGSSCNVDGCSRRRRHQGVYCSMHSRAPYAPDPEPLRVLRLELARARRQRTSFEVAWQGGVELALRSLPRSVRRDWLDALGETRAVWASAYDREPVRELAAIGAIRPE